MSKKIATREAYGKALAELAKEIQELEKDIKADNSLLEIELNKGHSTVATVERIKRNSSELERKTRELNKFK